MKIRFLFFLVIGLELIETDDFAVASPPLFHVKPPDIAAIRLGEPVLDFLEHSKDASKITKLRF